MRESAFKSDPAVSRLVDRQMRNMELARQQRLPGPDLPTLQVEDFVCVSRPVGAGGRVVAAELGRRLGWPVFDRELLQAMAGDDNIRARLYTSMDERDLGWLEESVRAVIQTDFVKNDYFHRLTETILSLARQSRAVFLGRAADLILPRDRGLRVRIIASVEKRVENYARQHGLAIEAARHEVRKLDQERAAFLRNHFGVDADVVTRHDLTFNMDCLSTEHVIELILAALRFRGMVS